MSFAETVANTPIPARLRSRPRDPRGYVITYVTIIDPITKLPDFHGIDGEKVARCARRKLCGLCGQPLGKIVSFIGGPEAVTNRLFSDPPMHSECGRYAMKVCPYLANANAKHGSTEMTRQRHPNLTIIENPLAGVVRPDKLAIYQTKSWDYALMPNKPGGPPCLIVFKTGKPFHLEWF